MNFIQKLIRRRAIKKIEKDIAAEYSKSIQEFLSKPVIAQLDAHFTRQNEIEQKLENNRRDRNKLANSKLWGNRFSADGYYRWNEELKAEYKERTVKIHEIYDLLGFEITEENLDKLKQEAVLYSKQNSVLDKRAREIIALENNPSPIAERHMVQASALAGGLGIAFHAGSSFAESMNVYEALRRANSNFAELSNSDIWLETMLLSLINPDSYQGMVNLAKGAYFEQLVANDTGGLLHENFNTPETDMLLDGSLVQLKASDSEAVIDSVAQGITVIATSEVASNTSAIDSGYSNEEVTNTTENALGGDVFDTSGSLIDGAVLFSGGIGVFASLKGLCAAGEYLEKNPQKNTGDNLQYLEESFTHLATASAIGLEVAVVSTINALPSAWNLVLTVVRWGLNIIHIILYPFIKIFG
tara:strand:+ start:5847 stop:7088 length:1242 start_codon:yes stop_codon:yes gene_type:complete